MKDLLGRLLAGVLVFGSLSAYGLEVGDAAPEATSTDENGEAWALKDYAGKNAVVVYFYPADMTPGCTKQACSYRDNKDALDKAGIKVFGVSGDSAAGHKIFRKAHDLNFTLLTDGDGSLAKAFGVPTGKGGTIQRKVDGESVSLTRTLTTQRWTFVISKEGKVIYKNTRVNPTADVQEVLKAVAAAASE